MDKYYDDMSHEHGLNFYKSDDGEYYVELGRYIDKISQGSVKEDQVLKNKCAVDREKVVKIKNLAIEKTYGTNKLNNSKRLVKVDGLITVNDSVKRFTKEISPESFRKWDQFCLLMLSVIPLQIQKKVEENLKKDLVKQNKIIDSHQFKIEKLEEDHEEMKDIMSYLKNEMKKKDEKLEEELKKKDRELEKYLKQDREDAKKNDRKELKVDLEEMKKELKEELKKELRNEK